MERNDITHTIIIIYLIAVVMAIGLLIGIAVTKNDTIYLMEMRAIDRGYGMIINDDHMVTNAEIRYILYGEDE